jgi:hypothetical protein
MGKLTKILILVTIIILIAGTFDIARKTIASLSKISQTASLLNSLEQEIDNTNRK